MSLRWKLDPPTLSRQGLEAILEGMDNGGLANHHSWDNHAGLSYTATFDPLKTQRPDRTLLNVKSHGDHYDVIERLSSGDVLHHRIYKP